MISLQKDLTKMIFLHENVMVLKWTLSSLERD